MSYKLYFAIYMDDLENSNIYCFYNIIYSSLRVEVLIITGNVLLTFAVKFQNFRTAFEFQMFWEFWSTKLSNCFRTHSKGVFLTGVFFLFSLKLNIFTMLKNKSIVSIKTYKTKECNTRHFVVPSVELLTPPIYNHHKLYSNRKKKCMSMEGK